MKKIAICISGHVRNFYLLKILEQLDKYPVEYKVFVSTWDTIGYRESNYDHNISLIDESHMTILNGIKNLQKIEIENDSKQIQEIKDVCNLYTHILGDEMPNYRNGVYEMDREEDRKYQVVSMFRKCQRSIDLIDDEEFDIIMRTRFDSNFDLNIVMNSIDSIIENNCILIPYNWSAGDETHPGGGRICDSFAIGPSKLIKIYSKTFDEFLNNENTPNYLIKNGVWFVPHSMLLHHLRLNNINYIKANINYDIPRNNIKL